MTIQTSLQPPSEELLATTFHELRTPVSSINGYSSILLSGELGKLNPRQRESLERIQELCQSMTTLIGNLITLTKSGIQRSHVTKEFVLVGQVADDVLRSLQGEVRQKKIRLVSRIPAREIQFWGEVGDFTQIFLNLLSNAVKFTPKEGRVEVQVTSRQDELVIEVSDTGVGIAPAELSKIFEEFYHVDHPEVGAQQGSGLGLAIVKRIVDGYQGRITVTSQIGSGSQFRVTLPIRSERQILQEFLSEAWVQSRGIGKSTGLILYEIRGSNKKTLPRDTPGRETDPLTVLERVLRGYLRKEDRVFRLSECTVVAVVLRMDPKGFAPLVRRLDGAIKDAISNGKLRPVQHFQWRMTSLLAPRHGGSVSQFLHVAEGRLKGAWEKGGGRSWNSVKNS